MATALRQPAAPESLETAKAFIAHEGARLCARVVGDRARAIVLTGSLSRGEATLKRDGLGWRALGDATFLIVFNRSAKVRTAEIESEIECHLISHGVRC